jgi:hypothetical protein
MKSFTLRVAFLLFGLMFVTQADAANRFAVCTVTCTWDASSTAMWSTTSGGATGASVPGSGDAVIFNGATCVGGVTCTITINTTVTVVSIDWGACTASTNGCIIDFSVNNNNVTVSGGSGNGINGAGTGTRKWLCGTGTFTFSSATNNESLWDLSTTTNLDAGSVFNTCPMTASGSGTGNNSFSGGGKSYGTVTFAAASGSVRTLSGNNTFATLVIGAGEILSFGNASMTITNALTVTGTSANPIGLRGLPNAVATLAIASGSTGTWMAIEGITFTGNTFVATNSLNMGRNTNATITVPATGGGSAPCIKC